MTVSQNVFQYISNSYVGKPIAATASQGGITTSIPAKVDHVHNLGTEGTVTLNGTATVTVSSTAVTSTSLILLTLNTVGGTITQEPFVLSKTAATGFTVAGNSGNTSTYQYCIIH